MNKRASHIGLRFVLILLLVISAVPSAVFIIFFNILTKRRKMRILDKDDGNGVSGTKTCITTLRHLIKSAVLA